MVGRNRYWYTDMGSSLGSASSEFCDLELAMESAELLFFYCSIGLLLLSAIACLTGVF